MSKSLGNVVAPQDVIRQSGAEILRLWAMSSDYAEDLRIGPEIVKANVESVPQAQEHAPLSARQSRPLSRPSLPSPTPRCPSSSATCSSRLAELDQMRARRLRGVRLQARASTRCSISASTISRPSISTSARTRSIAILTTA